VIRDKRRIRPCSAYLRGEYGINGIYVGVPVMLGKNGIEQIIELELIPEEKEALHASASSVKSVIETLESQNII
jgi:malate dehydrogenase